jgi:hypothetical protein
MQLYDPSCRISMKGIKRSVRVRWIRSKQFVELHIRVLAFRLHINTPMKVPPYEPFFTLLVDQIGCR